MVAKSRRRSYARAQKRQRDARLLYLLAKWQTRRICGVEECEFVGLEVQAAGEMNGGASKWVGCRSSGAVVIMLAQKRGRLEYNMVWPGGEGKRRMPQDGASQLTKTGQLE